MIRDRADDESIHIDDAMHLQAALDTVEPAPGVDRESEARFRM